MDPDAALNAIRALLVKRSPGRPARDQADDGRPPS